MKDFIKFFLKWADIMVVVLFFLIGLVDTIRANCSERWADSSVEVRYNEQGGGCQVRDPARGWVPEDTVNFRVT